MSSFFGLDSNDDDDGYSSTNIEYTIDSQQRLDFDSLTQTLADRDLPPTQREILCQQYYQQDPLTLLECINNIFSLFLENNLSYLRDALIHFSCMSFLPFPIRIKSCQSIVEVDNEVSHLFEQNKPISQRLQLEVCEDVIQRPQDPEFNHTLLFECLVDLLDFDTDKVIPLVVRILSSLFLEEDYRFKLVLYLKSKLMDSHKPLLQSVLVQIFTHFTNATHLVLLSQLIPIDQLDITFLQTSIRTDQDAAEICDFLLEANISEELTCFAKERLRQIQGVSKNVWTSSQNLHEVSVDIESFVEKMIEFDTTPLPTLIIRFPDLEPVLNRIAIDSTLYSSKAISIASLLGKCWACIQQHENRVELEKRVEQELTDMKDTCTSGHLVRLMNVFSGWMEGIRLDAKLEIQSVVFYRLQRIIEHLPPQERDLVIDELGSFDHEFAQASIQHHLFKPIAQLHDEMLQDYKGIVDDQKFAEYFRQALLEFTIEK